MAVSGVFTFDLTRTEIIESALQRIGRLSEGVSASATQLSLGTRWLNLVVKSLQNEGVQLWTQEWETQTLTASSEVTGTDGNVYTCIRPHTSASSNKPVTGADYSTYWTLAGSTGGVWATSTAYTSLSSFDLPARTVGIVQAFVRDTQDNDLPVDLIPFSDYLRISDKTYTGGPDSLAINDDISTPRAFLYPIPDDVTDVIHILRIRPLYDYDAASNTSDFPQRWLEVVIFGLAERLAHNYGLDINTIQLQERRFRNALAQAKGEDREVTTVDFVTPLY